jgi:hypothetical protein
MKRIITGMVVGLVVSHVVAVYLWWLASIELVRSPMLSFAQSITIVMGVYLGVMIAELTRK